MPPIIYADMVKRKMNVKRSIKGSVDKKSCWIEAVGDVLASEKQVSGAGPFCPGVVPARRRLGTQGFVHSRRDS